MTLIHGISSVIYVTAFYIKTEAPTPPHGRQYCRLWHCDVPVSINTQPVGSVMVLQAKTIIKILQYFIFTADVNCFYSPTITQRVVGFLIIKVLLKIEVP